VVFTIILNCFLCDTSPDASTILKIVTFTLNVYCIRFHLFYCPLIELLRLNLNLFSVAENWGLRSLTMRHVSETCFRNLENHSVWFTLIQITLAVLQFLYLKVSQQVLNAELRIEPTKQTKRSASYGLKKSHLQVESTLLSHGSASCRRMVSRCWSLQ